MIQHFLPHSRLKCLIFFTTKSNNNIRELGDIIYIKMLNVKFLIKTVGLK